MVDKSYKMPLNADDVRSRTAGILDLSEFRGPYFGDRRLREFLESFPVSDISRELILKIEKNKRAELDDECRKGRFLNLVYISPEDAAGIVNRFYENWESTDRAKLTRYQQAGLIDWISEIPIRRELKKKIGAYPEERKAVLDGVANFYRDNGNLHTIVGCGLGIDIRNGRGIWTPIRIIGDEYTSRHLFDYLLSAQDAAKFLISLFDPAKCEMENDQIRVYHPFVNLNGIKGLDWKEFIK